MYHGDQQFKDGQKTVEHSCKKKYQGFKYRDENDKQYPDIESFWNRTSVPEI